MLMIRDPTEMPLCVALAPYWRVRPRHFASLVGGSGSRRFGRSPEASSPGEWLGFDGPGLGRGADVPGDRFDRAAGQNKITKIWPWLRVACLFLVSFFVFCPSRFPPPPFPSPGSFAPCACIGRDVPVPTRGKRGDSCGRGGVVISGRHDLWAETLSLREGFFRVFGREGTGGSVLS